MNNGNLVTFIFFLSIAVPTGLADMIKPDKKILEIHLKKIAGERHPGPSAEHLAEVSRYVEDTFRNLGYETEKHPFEARFGIFENMIARKQGRHSNARIIVAAHLDTVSGTPGADDNASGVAVLLELARLLRDRGWNHTVELIGFQIEEWGMLGSRAYVKKLRQEKTAVRGMVSLEMVGFTSGKPKSQKMPFFFNLFYPDVGNFIGLVGNIRSISLMNFFKREMKKVHGLPVESLVMPLNGYLLSPTRWSDHSPFWDAGYPALMITDTSFYRNPNYHGPNDAIETLDLDFMAKVTEGVAQALVALDEKNQ